MVYSQQKGDSKEEWGMSATLEESRVQKVEWRLLVIHTSSRARAGRLVAYHIAAPREVDGSVNNVN